MISEAVVTTRDPDGRPHVTPLGYRMRGEHVLLAPFVPSRTLDNLRRHPFAVLNFTDDVRLFAGPLTGHRTWACVAAAHVDVPRLAGTLAHWEIEAVACRDDVERPVFECHVRHRAIHGPFLGFNRAQGAVIELAVLVSRLDWLPATKVRSEIAHLRSAVEKTAGPREREAWRWLEQAIAQHPRHAHEVVPE